ncbi:MAG: hypothetical protein IJ087_01335 [Eggerthellaceae bacterium]|nr:hypothetical protein [Eggerthellaceae bacterium]
MSCDAWMGCTVTVHEHEHDEAALEWCEAAMKGEDAEGNLTLFFEWEDAGWFDGALAKLYDDLESLPVPLDCWSADVRYEFYDEPNSDGCFTEFTIDDGEVTSCKESRIVMEPCKPFFEFDMKKGVHKC